jgi:large subunit ribosomal protein L17
MRHLKAGRKLGRNATHRLALYRNLALALFRHERIITTLQKAKAARPFIEKLITLAKKGDLHARRLAVARMGPVADAEVRPAEGKDEGDGRTIIQKLFGELGPRFQDRPGGYTRVIKRHERRLGDAGKTAFLELLKEGETRTRARPPAPIPAPRVEEEQPEQQPEETPPDAGASGAEGQAAAGQTPEGQTPDNPPAGGQMPPPSA